MVKITVTDDNDPAAITGVKTISYDENGTDPVATFSASDPDADAGDIDWDLEGVDAPDFEIEGGVLTFKKSPNYESPTDRDEDPDTSVAEGAGDRKYQVTVVASGGKQAVEVEVMNLNEDGIVTFTQLQAQVTRDLMAKFDDDDGEDDPTWQWSRGASADGPFTAIDGATSADRQPTADDRGMWLQATVSYTDSFSATSASGVIGPVVDETLANAAPSFAALDGDDDTAGVQIARSKGENSKGNIGDPLTATDANGDPRLYTITGGADKDCFGIGKTSGQLMLTAERDFESPLAACKTGGAARTVTDDTATANVDERQQYVVVITATDPSGATGNATVTVTITDANEAPKFGATAKADANVTLYIDENETFTAADGTGAAEDLNLRQNEVDRAETAADDGTNTAVVAYTATDEDGDATGSGDALLDTDDQIRYSVEGADKDQFSIGATTGVLTFATGDDKLGAKGADFEGKPSYSITIVATSGGYQNTTGDTPVPNRTVNDVDRTRYATLDVTIKVVDQEDAGKVKISAPEPQEGKSVLATLSDEDGGVTGVTWQWSRIAALAADGFNVKKCADIVEVTGSAGREWADISDATSPIYTPDSDTYDHDSDAATPEVGYCLRATAYYTDNIANTTADDEDTTVDEFKDTANNTPTRRVQKDDPANTAPEFGDQDPNTPGTQTVAERSVKENFEGKVGEPVIAADSDLLMYRVDDTDNFKVDNGGQISTKVKLDYEALPDDAKYYMVMLTATDPSGASDSIMVKITVTDDNDAAIITLAGGGPVEVTHPCVEGGAVSADATENLANDCQTLLDIMDDLVGDGGTALNWSVDTPIGQWEGVASGTGRVYRIHLADHGLAGVLPAGITALDALERLTLRDNDLGGDIPDLSDLDNLEWLVLHRNAFTGSLPDTLGDMDSLDYLYIYGNEGGFEGGVPASLGNSTSLRQVWLHDNGLTGEIPSELGNMSRLRYLILSGNMLTGAIPAELGDATNLKQLYLHDNMLSGEIPAELGNLMTNADDTLRRLYLNNNMLTGEVPAELGDLVSLAHVRLNGNMLTCIPAALADVQHNDFEAAGLMACAADDES